MISTIQFQYDNRRGGAGKTHDQLLRITRDPDLYLFVVDRVEIIEERIAQLKSLARDSDVQLHVDAIYSASSGRAKGVRSVRVAIEALPQIYTNGHICVFACHEGLKSADLSRFSEWHVVIDETPSLFDRCTLNSSVSAPLLAQLFDIEVGQDFNRLLPRKCIARRDLHLDSLAAPIATLHARASDPRNTVVTHLNSWADLSRDPRWTWWSLWSPAQLGSFASVTILAAAFERSLTFQLCQALAPELEWVSLEDTAEPRVYKERQLLIRYFAEAHEATRYRFDTTAGKLAVAKIAAHLSMRPAERIWTCNAPDYPAFSARLSRGYLSPRQAGTNAWAHIDEAAIIYSAKPDVHERRILTALDVDPDSVVETRERDTIYQFIARTSLRDPTSTRQVTAYVYDRAQAEALVQSFSGQAGLRVELELVDLGFAHDVGGRSATTRLTAEQRYERQRVQARERKRRERARKAAERTAELHPPADS